LRFIKSIVASWIAVVLCTAGCATLTPTTIIRRGACPPRAEHARNRRARNQHLRDGYELRGVEANKPGVHAPGTSAPATGQQQPAPIVRGQSPRDWFAPVNEPTAGNSDHWRRPMQVSGEPVTRGQSPGYGYDQSPTKLSTSISNSRRLHGFTSRPDGPESAAGTAPGLSWRAA